MKCKYVSFRQNLDSSGEENQLKGAHVSMGAQKVLIIIFNILGLSVNTLILLRLVKSLISPNANKSDQS